MVIGFKHGLYWSFIFFLFWIRYKRNLKAVYFVHPTFRSKVQYFSFSLNLEFKHTACQHVKMDFNICSCHANCFLCSPFLFKWRRVATLAFGPHVTPASVQPSRALRLSVLGSRCRCRVPLPASARGRLPFLLQSSARQLLSVERLPWPVPQLVGTPALHPLRSDSLLSCL